MENEVSLVSSARTEKDEKKAIERLCSVLCTILFVIELSFLRSTIVVS